MNISALSHSLPAEPALGPAVPEPKQGKLAEASRQFESILMRQFLSESMKSLLEGGEGGKVYGYMLTDTLADSMTKGTGMGLSSVLQTQLGKDLE